MAGTQPFQIRSEFDPRDMTLGDFIKLYEKESTDIGGRKNKGWGNLLRNNKALQPYLDQPATAIFGSVETKSQSFMTDIEKAAKGSASTVQSKIRTLEANIFPKLDALSKRLGEDLKGNLSPISTEVVKLQTRGKPATIDKQFNVGKIGELIENLQKHVVDNPADKPIANAILFGLEMGSRPSLGTEITTAHYIQDQFDDTGRLLGLGGRDGVVIPAGTVGIKRQGKDQAPNVKPYNAPLSSRALVILQDQSEYNSKVIGSDKISHYFQLRKKDGSITPVALEDMNRVLKVTTPFGMRQKILTDAEIKKAPPGTKAVQPMSDAITPKMLRNLYINLAVQSIKGPNAEQRVAMLLNRDVATNVGAQEVYMGTPGQYKQSAVKDLDQISSKSWGLFSLRKPEAVQAFTQENKIRNPKEFIFGTNTMGGTTNKFVPDEVNYMSRVDEGFAQFEPKNIGIQNTGIVFGAIDDSAIDTVFENKQDGKQQGYSQSLKDKIKSLGATVIDKASKNKNLIGAGVLTGGTMASFVSDAAQFAKDTVVETGIDLAGKAVGMGARLTNPAGMILTNISKTASDDVIKTDEEFARERNFREDDLVTDEEPNFLNQQSIQENTNAGQ